MLDRDCTQFSLKMRCWFISTFFFAHFSHIRSLEIIAHDDGCDDYSKPVVRFGEEKMESALSLKV